MTSEPGNWQEKSLLRFRIIPPEEGQTLRAVIYRRLPGISADDAASLVRAGGVYVNRLRVRMPSVRVAAGERLTVYPNAARIEPIRAEALRFIHRDANFVVLDKPAGVPVTATRESALGTLSDALLNQLRSEGVVRPYVGVVHRLDQGASGLVLFTIRSIANSSLHRQFVDHDIRRVYRLRCHGKVPQQIRCEAPLRKGADGNVRVVPEGSRGAQTAVTLFRPISTFDGDGDSEPEHIVEAQLETGRTHQIRVHAAHLGFPLCGDRRYGRPSDSAGHSALRLHAWTLQFQHPQQADPLHFESPLPAWAQA